MGITIVLHFLGILVMLEGRETFDASTLCKKILPFQTLRVQPGFVEQLDGIEH
jgi:hypothetical protein